MRFTWGWLCDHFQPNAKTDATAIINLLPSIGFEVDEVIDHAGSLAPFVIARINSVKPHPNANRLQLCQVDIGKPKPIEVVCGAANAKSGLVSVFAPVGAYVPGSGITLKAAEIRGVVSQGMLCSGFELGVSADKAGIIDLPPDAPIGASYAKYAGLDDVVIDIAITPNRGDCLGVRGIARDLAAAGAGKLKPLKIKSVAGKGKSTVAWRVDLPRDQAHLCPTIAGRSFAGLKNGQSPAWMQQRLLAVGQRPISALVDITNYIMLDIGRPLHAYDADKIKGGALTVRLAKAGESIALLNEKTYTLDRDMLVIGDSHGVDDLAGIMGGIRTAISASTTSMFLEIAIFDPVSVATTGRKLNINSDARYRFERGLDATSPQWAMDYASGMVLDICGGEASAVTRAGSGVAKPTSIAYRPGRCAELTGVEVAPARQKQILADLGFAVTGATQAKAWKITCPPWRGDMLGEADVVEEIIRIHGYDTIPQYQMPPMASASASAAQNRTGGAGLTPKQKQQLVLRRGLAARGMHEAVHFTFIDAGVAKHYGSKQRGLHLANPISQDLTVMRPSLLPGLLAAAARNQARTEADIALFEMGPAYSDDTPAGQKNIAAGLRVGMTTGKEWTRSSRAIDWLDGKSDALAGLAMLGLDEAAADLKTTAPTAPPVWYHPKQCGVIKQGDTVLAYFGSLHPAAVAAADVKGTAAAFEIMLDAIPEAASKKLPPLQLSPFQPVVRDFAFVVDDTLPAASLLAVIKQAGKPLITAVRLFDVYDDSKEIGANKKSLALTVTLQPTKATLTDAEIEAVSRSIITAVEKQCNAVLRS